MACNGESLSLILNTRNARTLVCDLFQCVYKIYRACKTSLNSIATYDVRKYN